MIYYRYVGWCSCREVFDIYIMRYEIYAVVVVVVAIGIGIGIGNGWSRCGRRGG